MKRYNRFKMLSNIQDEYILESMPDYLELQMKKHRKNNPMIRFFNSGWGVACICALVAVGVLAFIIRAGQDPWTPPGGTVEESESESPTLEESEAPTEADTTPYFDPDSLDLDTYRGMTPDVPYKIVYYSNGDGTCDVIDIIVNMLYKGDIVIEIPETSPDGDTVTEISLYEAGNTYNIPTYVLAEDFEKIRYAILSHYDFDENNFYYKQFMSYFWLYDAGLAPTPEDRDKYISWYPLCEYVPVYAFDPTATPIELRMRSQDISACAPWYTAEWCYSDLLKAKAMADELGVNDHNLEAFLERHSGNFFNVTDVKIPKSLKPTEIDFPYIISIDLFIFSDIGIREITFNGTVAEMSAIASPEEIYLSYPLVIHCTDGDITYSVKGNK